LALGAATILLAWAFRIEFLFYIFQTSARRAYSTRVEWVNRDALASPKQAPFRVGTLIPIQNDAFAFGQSLAPLPIYTVANDQNIRPLTSDRQFVFQLVQAQQ
jgi:hypothetical protein